MLAADQRLSEMMMERRERRQRRSTGEKAPLAQLPWKQPRRHFAPLRLLSDDQIETIHKASLDLLEEIGMDILNPEARQIFSRAGAIVADERVRIGRDIVEAGIGTAPEEFTFHARNPDRSIRIGGDWIAFAPVGGPPNCSDADHGRRPGTFEDNANFIRLAQHFNCIHTAGGGSTDALDVHASVRHLRIGLNKVLLSDKVLFTASTGRARLFDGMEMARLARGVSPEQFLTEPSVFTMINTNSPLKLDGPMAMGVIEMARHGQITCVTPFTLAGAMAPVTLAGALAEQNAEALAGLALN
jgi:trimethylamine---corrinoid protein Co-methyltransferase